MSDLVIANDRPLVVTYVGKETTRGTLVVPTVKWYGDMRLQRSQPFAERPAYNGTFFGDVDFVRGAVEVTGNASYVATYEDWLDYARMIVAGGGTGVTDGGSPAAFTHTKKPSGTADDLDTLSCQYGFPHKPYESSMVFGTELTIRADIDDPAACWMVDIPTVLARSMDHVNVGEHTAAGTHTATTVQAAALSFTADEYNGGVIWLVKTGGTVQVRLISDTTTDTITVATAWDANPVDGDTFILVDALQAGIADREREVIDGPGTDIWIDPATGTVGTTHIDELGLAISFNCTYRNNAYTKRALSNVNEASTKLGRGFAKVLFSVRMEDESPIIWEYWKDKTELQIRVQQTGAVIHDAVTSRARIDIFRAVVDGYTEDDRNSNITKTWNFVGLLDSSEAAPIEYEGVVDLATLPLGA
jgi:hypothetical protein